MPCGSFHKAGPGLVKGITSPHNTHNLSQYTLVMETIGIITREELAASLTKNRGHEYGKGRKGAVMKGKHERRKKDKLRKEMEW